MSGISAYLAHVYQLIQNLAEADAERYEEQILSTNRGNIHIRLRFSDGALLEISEAIVFVSGYLHWLSYHYHYQDSSGAVIFRYDNAPHHPEVHTHPDHKHVGARIGASVHPLIAQVLEEVRAIRG
jgi:hypothetical protein